MDDTVFRQGLEIAGWLLTVVGQLQIGMKRRQGFLTWVVANGVMVVLAASVGLWWSIGMYLTNTAVCIWTFRRWGRDERAMRLATPRHVAR